jgi:competence protein ComEC
VVLGEVIYVYQKTPDCIIVINNILINTGKICAAQRGTIIRAFGRFDRTVIDSFEGRLWLSTKQIDIVGEKSVSKDIGELFNERLNNFRSTLVSIYLKHVPEPEAGLVAGVVLGYKKDIGPDFYEQMVNSGSIHIAVASGYNILLVGGVILTLMFWFMKRNLAIWVAMFAMAFYAVLAGSEPPVIRAVWMAGLMYLGLAAGRGAVTYWILILTAWVMLIIEPSLVVSASFQLSIAASFGLMVVEPWMSKYIEVKWGNVLTGFVGSLGVTSSVSTMIVTMPIIWWHFSRMSPIGILSNSLILPFVPPLMIFGVGMLVFPAVFWVPTYALAHWVVGVIRFFGS